MNKQQDNEEIKENDPYLKALIFFSCFSPPRAPFLACCLLFTFRKSFPPPKILPCYLFFTIFLFLLKKNLSLSITFQPLFDSLSFSFQIFLCFLAPATHKKKPNIPKILSPPGTSKLPPSSPATLSQNIFFSPNDQPLPLVFSHQLHSLRSPPRNPQASPSALAFSPSSSPPLFVTPCSLLPTTA